MSSTSEHAAREQIDASLIAADWVIQNYKAVDLGKARGIALREVPLKSGRCDYLLLVDRKAVGVVEAKKVGVTLSTMADQSAHYGENLPDFLQTADRLPFYYESTGIETFFRDERDPEPRSRRVFSFHRPETLAEWLTEPTTLRFRLAKMPFAHPLSTAGMRECQVEAITSLEKSFAEAKPRALIQMATGADKTYTACAFTYRLIKYAGARRVLFLVDRANLGRQATAEFQQFVTPDTGRKFTELYNVQHLTSNQLDGVSRVTICTIQRLYSMLRGEELPEDADEISTYEIDAADGRPKEVAYNPNIPIETFDFIVTDECHRSIYGLWRQVLEYFDAFIIGLTATPSKQTIGFFNQNLVMEYNHERAVADGVNVGYEVYRIKTDVTERGGMVEKGFYVDKRSKETRATRWARLDEDFVYEARELDRSVVVKSQIRTVLQAFKDALFTELFPGRTLVPKTLIFAKDDSHAEDIVHIVREVFGKGNDFAKKITYKSYNTETMRYQKSEALIQEFRTSPQLRIAVTVDTTLAERLARLDREITGEQRKQVEEMGGKPLAQFSSSLLRAIDPDVIAEKATGKPGASPDEVVPALMEKAWQELIIEACKPFDRPALRNYLAQAKQEAEQIIDVTTIDKVTVQGFDAAAKEKAASLVKTFRDYVEQHRAEIAALQILYSRPYRQRLTESMLKELERKLRDANATWNEETLWQAFAATAPGKVKGRSVVNRFADLVPLVRFALEQQPVPEPFAESVTTRFESWLVQKTKAGTAFNPDQRAWLELIRDHIATSLSIEPGDFDYAPLQPARRPRQGASIVRCAIAPLLEELNVQLVA